MEDCWLEASDRTLDELKGLGAFQEKGAKKFDKASLNVRVNLTILARKMQNQFS